MFNLLTTNNKLINIAKAPGTFLKILYFSFCGLFVYLKLPSGKKVKNSAAAYCVLGKNAHVLSKKEIIGSAGRN
jgi:ribosomal protein L2